MDARPFPWLELRSDRAVAVSGALLALTHVITFVHWRVAQPLESVAAPPRVCWPMFPDCAGVDGGAAATIAWSYGALALVSLALCVASVRSPKLAPAAWVAFLVVTVATVGIVLIDFRLRLNQHLMSTAASFVWLAWPRKRDALRIVIVLFYVWAGALKLDGEWLSGSALYDVDALWLPRPLLPLACVYVVILELALAPLLLLLRRRQRLFIAIVAQLALFHVMSWPIVSFFYPTLMLALLGVVVVLSDGARPALTKGNVALAAAFSSLQLLPAAIPGDSAITGEGRLVALHMFDARVHCEARLTLVDEHGRRRELPAPSTAPLPWRIRCDPVVLWNYARQACAGVAERQGARIAVEMRGRRSGERELRMVVDVDDWCAMDPSYSIWRRNAWIRVE